MLLSGSRALRSAADDTRDAHQIATEIGRWKMEIQSRPTTVRTVTAAALVATIAFTLLASTAEANRARRAVVGGTIGAGVGALVDGGSGARTGAAAGALIGAVSR
jgi:hypothetical protein